MLPVFICQIGSLAKWQNLSKDLSNKVLKFFTNVFNKNTVNKFFWIKEILYEKGACASQLRWIIVKCFPVIYSHMLN